MGQIFISYRREDSQAYTDRIYEHLARAFGRGEIFKDVDNVPPGVDFRTHVVNAVDKSKVTLAVIGPGWSRAADKQGRRRLDDPDDFVRIEIEAAMTRGVPVIPVLVGGAAMPPPEDFPGLMHKLAFINGVHVRSDPDFANDIVRLKRGVERLIAGGRSTNWVRAAIGLSCLAIALGLVWWFWPPINPIGPLPNKSVAPSVQPTTAKGPALENCRDVTFVDSSKVPPVNGVRRICD